ncbi:MAG: hypothetical protein U0353_05285 [Sandaracinus sp.]
MEPSPRTSAPSPPSDRIVRTLGVLAVIAVGLHVLGRAWLASEHRFFATEDDGYRAYYGHLVAEGTGSVIGRFWLPGQFFVLGALGRLGLDAAQAPMVLGAITFVMTIVAVHSLARDLAPQGWGDAAGRGAIVVASISPLVLVLSHSALAEPLANALVAFAAAALVRRHRVGPRRLVWSGAMMMLLATWVRYEAWAYALVFVVSAIEAARRREGVRSALVDGAVASIALIGPFGWLLAQHLVHGDALAFLDTIEDMSVALSGEASRSHVALLRLEALSLWAGGAVVGTAAALWLWRRGLAPLRALGLLALVGVPGLVLELASGSGLGVFVVDGREIEFFAPRLVSNLEIGLVPLAGLGLATLLARAEPRSHAAAVAALALPGALLVLGLSQPVSFVDPSSVRAGVMLRGGELDDVLGRGALLVERVEPRPPMGWASLSVLWSEWERTIFFTRRRGDCDMVEASNIVYARSRIACRDLAGWASRRGVTAAWVLSPEARELFDRVWPDAESRTIGDGHLLRAAAARVHEGAPASREEPPR